MRPVLSRAEVRELDRLATLEAGVPSLALMETAGRGACELALKYYPEIRRVVVVCGVGNNGGDGFVVARLLKERGWEVEVFLYGDAGKLPPDAKVNCERWRGMGEVRRLAEFKDDFPNPCALVVDALFGTGLTRLLDEEARDALGMVSIMSQWMDPPRVVAVDTPSGICADSGVVLFEEPEWVQRFVQRRPGADMTVTFERPKIGHHLLNGPGFSGTLRVVSLGIEHEEDGPLYNSRSPIAELAAPLNWRLGKLSYEHKYAHGHALVLSGPAGRTGAARLAARGTLRVGAGLVTVGAPREALAEHAAQLDAVLLREVGDGAALAEALKDERISALCLGPGMGLDERARGLVAAALGVNGDPAPGLTRGLSSGGSAGGERGSGSSPGRVAQGQRSVVLDADALTILSLDPALFAALHDRCVLTPHAGEFGRLFPDIAEKLAAPATKGPAYSKVDATREAAARAGCVVLCKGADTVIADPSGRCSINSAAYERAAPWLASAGSGDVLAGFIAGLLARGFAPMQAAETAAWLHVECARSFGPGLIAEDLPEELPKVFRSLGL